MMIERYAWEDPRRRLWLFFSDPFKHITPYQDTCGASFVLICISFVEDEFHGKSANLFTSTKQSDAGEKIKKQYQDDPGRSTPNTTPHLMHPTHPRTRSVVTTPSWSNYLYTKEAIKKTHCFCSPYRKPEPAVFVSHHSMQKAETMCLP
mmetsp:Transcript_44373/g.140003  ORF Transcript_44373/g.140003 Transcript_44373/m.140003 type:complete len:149 (+) Transcript_44373:1165-1611(+)